MSELKPCPFCGGEDIQTKYSEAHSKDYYSLVWDFMPLSG